MHNATMTTRPNIVLLMLDDMGFSDIGCFGGEIQTPHLDRLGHQGVRFTQFYNGARCCPTRASLLTGLYAHQTGVGSMTQWTQRPAYRGCINRQCVTIAEVLRTTGYRTCMSGKWHVGGDYKMQDPQQWRNAIGDERHPTPMQRGFDQHYGILTGACSYWNPATLVRNDTFLEPPGPGYYLTDALTTEACGMVRQAAADDKPFFLYWSPTTPHWPLHAHAHDIDKYRNRYDRGWDPMRQERYQRQLDMGLIKPEWQLSPRDEKAQAWETIPDKRWESLRMAVYAAQMDNLDQNVGRLLAVLDELGIADNTMFIFLSDNGACAEFLREDSQPNSWPGHYALPTADGKSVVSVGNRRDLDPGPDGTFMSYDLSWANASNTPFRKFKCWANEGGIATPCIVHWPQGMAGGRIHHGVGHIIDIMPTILDAAGVTYPQCYADQPIHPTPGESLLPAIQGRDDWQRANPLYWEHNGHKAVRDDDWKLVQPAGTDQWSLYDMSRDRTELHDLATEQSDTADRLHRQWQTWAEQVDV